MNKAIITIASIALAQLDECFNEFENSKDAQPNEAQLDAIKSLREASSKFIAAFEDSIVS